MAIQDRFSLRNLYLYLVCLITLVISIFAAVNVVRSAAELLYPEPGYYVKLPMEEPDMGADQQQRLERAARAAQQRQAVLGLISSGALLLIAGPVYAYHWRRIQAELPSRSAPPEGSQPPPA
ncbi:hypothetical protein KZZ52_28070 [Dactylosporangium sp. AC04546]|uniref:hypothetical protein n=1 Tax=Dactylosporangium sp. AC04546 TaxID=2862460 RepID=UPI001EDEC2C0|nr:hypothetical protein [Dactylosporangium sp. AC04546]WVK89125.1 hypothetical protein KZZ52_28070 [Dactylosporangium sp. AC04546]